MDIIHIVLFLSIAWIKRTETLLATSVPRLPVIDFVHRVQFDQMGAYVMLWTPREDDVIFELQVQTKGYIGLGFSPNGGMKDADIVLGWVDSEGLVHFSDRHGVGNRTPVEDNSQDYELLGGYTNDTHTVLRFSRPWITCDSSNDFSITEDTVRVIWAYDAVVPDSLKDTMNVHDHRGTKSLYLKEPKMNSQYNLRNTKNWEIRAPKVKLPSDFNTLYWCKLYKIPTLPWKHQMIGYIPVISEASLPHVHHMLLYECKLANSEAYLEMFVKEKGAQCYSRNMPVSWTACGTPIVAWAIGSQGEMLPDHVGYPLGEKFGGATYFLLEIHYDNPELKEGVVDESGLRLFLTDQLRDYDAGVLTVGHKVEPSMIIPPGRTWSTTAHCTADCTQKTIPTEGIRVFSAILHAHLLGRDISLQHIREGTELEPLIVDRAYDFNYQQARFLAEEKTIKPGDHLISTCVYNSTFKSKPTFGGFGTDDEMCLIFLSYYPRLNLGECYSRPDLALLFDVFGIQNLYENDVIMKTFSRDTFDETHINSERERAALKSMSGINSAGTSVDRFNLVDFFRIINISEPENLRGKTFYDIITSDSTWKDENLVERLSDAISFYQYEPNCLYSGRGIVEGLPKKAKIPHYIAYTAEAKPCQDRSNRTNVYKSPSSLDEVPPLLEESQFMTEKFTGIDSVKKSEEQLSPSTRKSGSPPSSTQIQTSVLIVLLSLCISI